jgi:hypothetical protein
MTTMRAISTGLRAAWRAKWMVLIFFATNLLLAAAIAAPMQTAIADHLGNSAVGSRMARGFDWSWLAEFQIAYAPFLKSFSIAVVYGAILFLVLNVLLSAGAFEYFAQRFGARATGCDTEVPALHVFGRGIGRNFLRFARIAIVASLFYFLAFWLWQVGMAKLLDRIFEDSPVERWHFYLEWVRWALLIFTVLVINMFVDYAKADVAVDQHQSVLAAIGHGAGFVVANFGRVLAIYFGFAVFAGISVLVYSAFARFFPQSSVATVLAWFLVAQALLWARWMFRLASWGAAVAYYSAQRAESVTPQPAPVEVQV